MSKAPRPTPVPDAAATDLARRSDDERAALETSLGRLDRLARLMDDQFELPLVRYRIGLDPILGIIPGGGDWVTWVVGVYIFWEALGMDIPRRKLARMVYNLVVDLIGGYVPGVGDVFDAIFKANRKNVDLLLDHYGATRTGGTPRLPAELPAKRTSSTALRYLAGFGVVLVLLGVAALPFVLIWWLLHR